MKARLWLVGVSVSAVAAAVACASAGRPLSAGELVLLAGVLTAPALEAVLPRRMGE